MSAALAYSFEDLAGFDASNDNVPLSSSIDTGQSGLRTLAYDAQGNVTTLGNLAFLYDYSDQPVVVSGTANGVGAANGAYTYDGNLKRVKSVVNGKTIYNVYDASGSLVHIDAVTDNKKTDYVSGPNGSLARITNDVVTYLHPDHLGSAQSGTNRWGGIEWRERYTPFGEEIVGPAANDNLAGFTGHIKDKATGLNYMQARYYDPVIGRFLSIDPVTFMDTGNPSYFNRYRYCSNDPVNCTDPTGRSDAFGTTDQILFETVAYAFQPVVDFFNPVPAAQEAFTDIKSGNVIGAAAAVGTEVFKPAKGVKRLRHFTNKGSLKGIKADNKIKAKDQNSVFAVDAKGKPGSPRDVESNLGIKRGKGNAMVEFDAKSSEFSTVKNSKTGATERVFKGDVDLAKRNPKFKENR